MKNNYLKIVLFFSLIITGCDPWENKFRIINKSDKDIFCFYSCDTILDDIPFVQSGYFPDAAGGKGDSMYVESDNLIRVNSSRKFYEYGFNAWNHYLKKCDNKIYVFFYNDSVVLNNTKHDLISKNLYIKRVKYTLDDLEKLNWTVTYP